MSKARAEKRALPKRFYAAASLQQYDEAFVIALDGKYVHTPQRKLLRTASHELAQGIVAEWEAQAEFIDTDTMPLTRLLNIAIDRAAIDRAALLADIFGYAETDLLCYRAPLENAALDGALNGAALRNMQAQHFDPILAWASAEYGVVFVVMDGLMPVPQPPASLERIAALFAAANDHEMTALAMLVPLLGSALLALALWKEHVSVEAALAAARLDEAVQAEQWGEDAETAAAWATKTRDIHAAVRFLLAT